MSNLIGKEAPDFKAKAVLPENKIVENFSLKTLRGKYIILIFYPGDFTYICPTEILAFESMYDAFTSRDTEVIGLSVDSAETHLAWRNTHVEEGGIGQIRYPLISDSSKNISRQYDVLEHDGVALRALFIIDREGIVRHATYNDSALGRNVSETIRLIDALRFHEDKGQLCPANWQKGLEGVTPTKKGVIDYLSKFAPKANSTGPHNPQNVIVE